MDPTTRFLETMLTITTAVLLHTATAIQYLSLCALATIMTPLVLLLSYDLALYASHVLRIREYAAALVANMHTLKIQNISTTRIGIQIKTLGKKQLYNQKVIYEAAVST